MLDYKKLFHEIRDLYADTTKVIADLEMSVARLHARLKKQKDEIKCLKMKQRGRHVGDKEKELEQSLK